jgi:cell division protein ZapA (FtsZ GTPase activity inhibitor)
MSKEETKHITVVIAGRPFPVTIPTTEEVALRNVVKSINDKINHFQLTYPQRDKQDYLSMTLLTLAFDQFKKYDKPNPDFTQAQERILEIDKLLSSAFSDETAN